MLSSPSNGSSTDDGPTSFGPHLSAGKDRKGRDPKCLGQEDTHRCPGLHVGTSPYSILHWNPEHPSETVRHCPYKGDTGG